MSSKKKLYSLQVFRAVAAILVVLYHMGDQSLKKLDHLFFGGLFSFGYTGVDFFFVLSGFIIFFVHQRDIGQPRHFTSYLQKRFIRIYPIFWIIAFLKLAAILIVPTLAESSDNGVRYIVSSFLLLPQRALPIVGVAWTLSYELFFYLIFGTAILFGRRWAIWSLSLWAAAIIAARLWGLPFLPEGSDFAASFVLNERNLEFLFGILVALIITKSHIAKGQYLILLGVAAFLASGYYVNSNNGEPPFSLALTFGLASALIVVGSVSIEMHREISWPLWLVYLGDASYSVYLTHALFMNVWLLLFIRSGLADVLGLFLTTLIILVLSIVGGCMTYSFMEMPVTRMLRKRLFENPRHQATSTTLDTATTS